MPSEQASGTADLLTLIEAGRYVRMSSRWVWSKIQSGEIPAVRLGRKAFVTRVDLDAFLSKQKVAS